MGNIYVGMVLITQQVLSMNVYKLFIESSAIPIRKKNLVKRATASCCRGCWPAQGADVSKSVQHDEESEANLGDEEHANTLQDTDAHHHFWFPT